MDEAGITEILGALGCTRIRPSGEYVYAACPLAPYLHKNGSDRHPSFSVKLAFDRPSCYHCFACGSSGTVLGLLAELERNGAIVGQALFDRVRVLDAHDPVEKRKRYADNMAKDILVGLKKNEDEVWLEEELSPYRGKVHKYILDRGLSLETCKKWELGYDSEKKRIVFPVRRGGDAALVGAMGRTVLPDGEPKYLTYFNFHKSRFLYGEHFLKKINEPVLGEVMGYDLPAQSGVIVVEGLMDVLRLFGLGYENVVGVMTSRISLAQIQKLKETGRDVYLMLDWDLAGIQGRTNAIKPLVNKIYLYDVPGVTVCRNCGYRWCCEGKNKEGKIDLLCAKCGNVWEIDRQKKDPDGLSDEELLDCLAAAERIKNLT